LTHQKRSPSALAIRRYRYRFLSPGCGPQGIGKLCVHRQSCGLMAKLIRATAPRFRGFETSGQAFFPISVPSLGPRPRAPGSSVKFHPRWARPSAGDARLLASLASLVQSLARPHPDVGPERLQRAGPGAPVEGCCGGWVCHDAWCSRSERPSRLGRLPKTRA